MFLKAKEHCGSVPEIKERNRGKSTFLTPYTIQLVAIHHQHAFGTKPQKRFSLPKKERLEPKYYRSCSEEFTAFNEKRISFRCPEFTV